MLCFCGAIGGLEEAGSCWGSSGARVYVSFTSFSVWRKVFGGRVLPPLTTQENSRPAITAVLSGVGRPRLGRPVPFPSLIFAGPIFPQGILLRISCHPFLCHRWPVKPDNGRPRRAGAAAHTRMKETAEEKPSAHALTAGRRPPVAKRQAKPGGPGGIISPGGVWGSAPVPFLPFLPFLPFRIFSAQKKPAGSRLWEERVSGG